MDAFFASVEQRDDPRLKGKCVVVGGPSRRGVVCAASYEARVYGVRSAMPMFEALKRCPHAVVVPPKRDRYTAASRIVMEIFRRYTPLVEPVSIDEAYLDIGGCGRIHGDAYAIGKKIKRDVTEATQLTCSVGAASLKFLAKIASDMDKPDGLTVISPAQTGAFIQQLPIEKVPGVGASTREKTARLGIHTLGDVAAYPPDTIRRHFGKFGDRLIALSQGIDITPVSDKRIHKSVSSEETLETDTTDRALLMRLLLKHAEETAKELRKLSFRARTVILKIKHADFTPHTRSKTQPAPIITSDDIYRAAAELLRDYPLNTPVRLIGVGVSGLIPQSVPIQRSLFEPPVRRSDRWEKADRAIDAVSRRFGPGVVGRACGLSSSKENMKNETETVKRIDQPPD
jgi:DNA polymerase-4